MRYRSFLFVRAGIGCIVVGCVQATVCPAAPPLNIGVTQEFGYEERVQTEARSGPDAYSRTSIGITLKHPVVLFDGKLSLDPALRLSYIDYVRFDSLDTLTFDISGPLRLDLYRGGVGPDALAIAANLNRDQEIVSTRRDVRTATTTLRLNALYTRHLRRSRWKTETGYDYARIMYDDAEYDDLERGEHVLSLAMLYAISRKLDAGLRGSYRIENFRGADRDDARIAEIASLARWRLTGRMEAAFEVGHETVSSRRSGAEKSGMTVRGSLDWQPTPRWRCAADVRHQFAVNTERDERHADRSRVSTTRAALAVSRNVTPRLRIGITPAVNREGGDSRVIEYLLDVSVGYAFRMFDFTAQTGVTERRSQAGGEDAYTAARALIRFDMNF